MFKADDKLQLNGQLKLVLEKDGTEVDDEDILFRFKNEVFMLLEANKAWKPEIQNDSVVIQASDIWDVPDNKNEAGNTVG